MSSGFFTDMLLYRVIPGFLIQFGVAADPKVQAKWQNDKIPDEPNLHKFRGGTLSFAGAKPKPSALLSAVGFSSRIARFA